MKRHHYDQPEDFTPEPKEKRISNSALMPKLPFQQGAILGICMYLGWPIEGLCIVIWTLIWTTYWGFFIWTIITLFNVEPVNPLEESEEKD